MRPGLPRLLAITPPAAGPWLDGLGALADVGVDGLLIRIFDDDAAVARALAGSRRFPVVLLRWQGPDDVARAQDHGVGLHLPARVAPVAHPVPGLRSASCHSLAAVAAAAGLELCTLSPVFPPGSKPDDRRPPLGPGIFSRCPPGIGALALGGMDPARTRALRARGAAGAAGIGAFFRRGAVYLAGARAMVAAAGGAERAPGA